jgi:hypothetical protein
MFTVCNTEEAELLPPQLLPRCPIYDTILIWFLIPFPVLSNIERIKNFALIEVESTIAYVQVVLLLKKDTLKTQPHSLHVNSSQTNQIDPQTNNTCKKLTVSALQGYKGWGVVDRVFISKYAKARTTSD